MLSGFNTEFTHNGRIYHVQTEDNGVSNPLIVTLLYLKGAILASKRTSYQHLLGKKGFQGELMEAMRSQHQKVTREVLAGKYDLPQDSPGPETCPITVEAAVPKTLDQEIMGYLKDFSAVGAKTAGPATDRR